MRVYELAKKLGETTNEFIKKLSSWGITKTNLSVLDDEEIKTINKKIIDERPPIKKEVKNNLENKPQTNVSKQEVIAEKMVFRKKEFKNDKEKKFNKENKFQSGERRQFNREDRSQNGERKQFNRDNRPQNSERKPFNKEDRFQNGERRQFNKEDRFQNGERKQFNKEDRFQNGERKQFNREDKFQNGERKSFDFTKKPFNKDFKNDDKKQSINRNKQEDLNIEIPLSENETKSKNNKIKSKFDKKKYENEKRAKEEERKLKEFKHDFRKEDKKKKIKKKEKISKSEVIREEEGGLGLVTLPNEISIKDLALKIGINTSDIVKKFFIQGKMFTANAILTFEEAEELALEYNIIVEKEEEISVSYGEKYNLEIEDREEDKIVRAPIITIMGHVDHGKTSLLDALRHTRVIDGEAGGITQSIGAYQVEWNGKKITFIDTPGHEAFTEMRVRGANITDISILVVAADDGVKPQTIEAISHAKEAGVPIIVAINKIDKPDANPMKVKQELLEYELISPEWGGTTEMVEISAKEKINLEALLETITITAELLELKANPKKRAKAIVVESRLDLQMGPVADILIKEGELKVGDIFVAGSSYGRVRTMIDDRGNKITKAKPSQPVEITGFNEIAEAGDLLYCVNNDKQAKKIIEDYKKELKNNDLNKKKHISLESLSKELEDQQLKELKCIIRGDSKGSVEALKESLNKLSNDKVNINIIHSSAGAITEGDVMLASASNAIIIGFGVRPTNSARTEAEKTGVEIRNYNVIYHVTEDIEKAMLGLLDPEYKEIYNARLQVVEVFKISNVGNIAGSLVVEGKITRNSKVRLLRDGIIIYEGEITSLKRYKDDMKEVVAGQDCGIGIKDFNDIKIGDIIEAYTLEQIKR